MESPIKGLNIPLQKRNWFPLLIAPGSVMVGWLWHRPTSLAPILASCIVSGAAVWFFLASPVVVRFGTHRNILVRVVTLLFALVGLTVFMQKVVPYLHGLVG